MEQEYIRMLMEQSMMEAGAVTKLVGLESCRSKTGVSTRVNGLRD